MTKRAAEDLLREAIAYSLTHGVAREKDLSAALDFLLEIAHDPHFCDCDKCLNGTAQVRTCAALDCDIELTSAFPMCKRHWGRVPRVVQNDAQTPRALDAAIGAVAVKEGKPITEMQSYALVSYGFSEPGFAYGRVRVL